MHRRPLLAAVVSVLALFHVAAQSSLAQRLDFTPYNANGIYDLGEEVGWTATLPEGATAPADPYSYSIKKNNFGDPIQTGTLDLANGPATIEITLDEPAMLYVQVTAPAAGGRGGRGGGFGGRGGGIGGFGFFGGGGMTLGAAVAPTKLQPSVPRPDDFDAFWDAKLKALDEIPMNPVLSPGDSGREGVDFFTVKLDSLGSNVQGYLAKPAKEGKFPAVVILQWAGVYALERDEVLDRAAEGWLALNVDSHDKTPSSRSGPPTNYQTVGNTDRQQCYFLPMYLRDTRAIDYITSLPEWDGKTLVVMGTSMGGQQSLCVAGLNPKVTHVIVNVPSGCDFDGPLAGRTSGYPNWPSNDPKILETGLYFDAVSFAPRIKAACLVAMGFVDTTSPPVGIWTAFNQIPSPKEAAPMIDSPHNNFATPAQQLPYTSRSAEWLATLVAGGEVEPNEEMVQPKRSKEK